MGHRMRVTPAPLYVFLLISACAYAFIPGADGPISHQEALEGGNATLLCDTTPDSSDDEFMILVWYKNNLPIYSFEVPDREWSEPFFNTENRLKADLRSQLTSLTITALNEDDQALYHCRVDFRLSPTRNLGVNLTVVVLPSPPFFMDEVNNKVESKIGPYHDGDTLVIHCLVIGGRPPPRISWYSGDTLVDASDSDSDIPKVRENELYLPLTRKNAADLSCRATNTKLAPPVVATLEIELYLPAYNVSIHWISGTEGDSIQAGRVAILQCTARGSYPQPDFTWMVGQRHLTQYSNQSWDEATRTAVSFLELTPIVSDNGGTLQCLATNPVMDSVPGSNADVIKLNVTYSPIIEVSRLKEDGYTQSSMNEVVELDPLNLECKVKANPPVHRFMWYFNDSEIKRGGIWGEHVSSQKLDIVETTRHHAGRYSCAAANSIGETRAEDISVTVYYPPECAERGITLQKEAISCNVKALPVPDTYFWHVQPSGFDIQHLTTGSPLLPLGQITGSLAGTLKTSCEASNGIASQEEQCEIIFSFEHLRPQQPHQCDLAFEYGEFQMRCIPVENATYYEVSVWKMSTANTSLILERRASMGFGSGHALAQGAWLVRAALGALRAGDEAGAMACNRYGCSRALLLRPTENLLQAAAPPWYHCALRDEDEAGAMAWNRYGCSRALLFRPTETLLQAAAPPWYHFILERDVGITLGALVLIAVFVISTYLVVRLTRRPRLKTTQPVIQVLQLDDVARNYLDNIGEHKIHASCSLRSYSSGYSEASAESGPTVDRRRKPTLWDRWEQPPPDVTLTLSRESAV